MGRQGIHPLKAALLVLLCAGSASQADPPEFYNSPPEVNIVDLRTGQNSFMLTGFVRDSHPFHTVSFWEPFGLAPFMTWEATPGNPASFRLYASNLTGAQYGGYLIDIVAIDNGMPFASATSYRIGIGIIPEPTTLGVGLALALARRTRR